MIPVYLYTPGGKLVQRLETASGQLGRSVTDIGNLEVLVVPPSEIGADYRIVVEADGESNVLWLVTDYEEVPQGADNLLRITAKDGKFMFTKRHVIAYNDTAEGYKINYPQVVAYEVIREAMASGNVVRDIPGLDILTVPTSLIAGAEVWEGEVAWKQVWDVMTTLMEFGRGTSNPFMVDFVAAPNGGNHFQAVIARRIGIPRTFSAPQLARMGINVRVGIRSAESVERAYALGSGDGSLALYAYHPLSVSSANDSDPFRYKESVVSSGNEDDLDALTTTARSAWGEARTVRFVTIEGTAATRGFWGKQIGYGDALTLVLPDGEYQTSVVGYSLEWEGAGEPSVSLSCAEGY